MMQGGELMEHNKTYYQRELNTSVGHLVIEGPIPAEQLERYEFHEDLGCLSSRL